MNYREQLLNAIDHESVPESVYDEVKSIIDSIESDVNEIENDLSNLRLDSIENIKDAFDKAEELSKELF